jgi:hypothetical protein
MSAITIIDTSSTTSAAPPPRQYTILTLSYRDYLFHNNDIYELQSVSPNGGKYASFMVASRFISNPDMHVATMVDPLFFVMEHFTNDANGAESGGKWQPFDQLFKDVPQPVLAALGVTLNISSILELGQLAHLFDISDVFDDDIVCKFNEAKALSWLTKKYERSFEALHKRKLEKKRRLEERKQSGEYGAFNSSFVLGETKQSESATSTKNSCRDNETITLTNEEEQAIQMAALQLLSEYLPSVWRTKLAKSLNLSEQDMTQTIVSKSGEKRPRSAWEGAIGQVEADELLTRTTGQGKSTSVTPVENTKNAQTAGLKRLAKVNTKGMKSLTSFFGGKKKG